MTRELLDHDPQYRLFFRVDFRQTSQWRLRLIVLSFRDAAQASNRVGQVPSFGVQVWFLGQAFAAQLHLPSGKRGSRFST